MHMQIFVEYDPAIHPMRYADQSKHQSINDLNYLA